MDDAGFSRFLVAAGEVAVTTTGPSLFEVTAKLGAHTLQASLDEGVVSRTVDGASAVPQEILSVNGLDLSSMLP